MNNILKTAIVLLGASTLMTGCIKETFPLEGVATEEQVKESPYATSGLVSAIYTSLITNYIGIGDHFDFGYPGIFGATDGNVYADRWQPWQYNIALGPTGAVTPFTWYNYYSFIKCANDAIRGTKNSTTEAGKQNYGLAKAFRALFYLDMARMYDPLPAKAPARQSYEAELEKVKGLTVPIVTSFTVLRHVHTSGSADLPRPMRRYRPATTHTASQQSTPARPSILRDARS